MASFVDKSLIWLEQGRYRQHPLLKEYAKEELDENPNEKQRTQKQYATYYGTLTDNFYGQFENIDQTQVVKATEQELQNITDAWHYSLTMQDLLEQAKSCMRLLTSFYTLQGRFVEAAQEFRQAIKRLEVIDELGSSNLLIELYQNLGSYLSNVGQVKESISTLQKAFELQEDDHPLLNRSYYHLSGGYGLLGELKSAKTYAEKLIHLTEHKQDADEYGQALYVLSLICRDLGEVKEAKIYAEKLVDIDRREGSIQHLTNDLLSLGVLELDDNNLEAAEK